MGGLTDRVCLTSIDISNDRLSKVDSIRRNPCPSRVLSGISPMSRTKMLSKLLSLWTLPDFDCPLELVVQPTCLFNPCKA